MQKSSSLEFTRRAGGGKFINPVKYDIVQSFWVYFGKNDRFSGFGKTEVKAKALGAPIKITNQTRCKKGKQSRTGIARSHANNWNSSIQNRTAKASNGTVKDQQHICLNLLL